MAGLSSAGFDPKKQSDIEDELRAAFRAAFGASIDFADTSNFNQLVAIVGERFADLWEAAEAVYSAFDPDKAEGQAQVALCALTGTVPKEATKSTATGIATGTAATPLLAGRVVSVAVVGTRFETTADATLAAATAWSSSTAYGVGAVVANSGKIYYCSGAGTSAGSGGPTTADFSITDGTVTWRFMGAGAAYAVLQLRAQETGPRIAVGGTLTVIETPVSGWNAVSNPDDADLGANAETEAELRLRREDELLGSARSTIDAIRVRVVEDVPGVFGVVVFQNDTDFTDADGRPPHSVEVMCRGGDDQDIVDAIFANVAAGITTYGGGGGATTGTYVDVDNAEQEYTVRFTRPDEQDVYVVANVVKDPNFFPADGVDQIKAAIAAYGATVQTGKNVVSSRLKAECFKVPGVLDVTTLYVGLAPAPASEATVAIALRELAVYATARVTVNVSDGVP